MRKVMKELKFPIRVLDPSARITTFYSDFFHRLDAAGLGDFRKDSPRHTVRMMVDKICPPALKAAVDERLVVEAGLKDSVRLLTERLNTVTRACQALGQTVRGGGGVSTTQERVDRHLQKFSTASSSQS